MHTVWLEVLWPVRAGSSRRCGDEVRKRTASVVEPDEDEPVRKRTRGKPRAGGVSEAVRMRTTSTVRSVSSRERAISLLRSVRSSRVHLRLRGGDGSSAEGQSVEKYDAECAMATRVT